MNEDVGLFKGARGERGQETSIFLKRSEKSQLGMAIKVP